MIIFVPSHDKIIYVITLLVAQTTILILYRAQNRSNIRRFPDLSSLRQMFIDNFLAFIFINLFFYSH